MGTTPSKSTTTDYSPSTIKGRANGSKIKSFPSLSQQTSPSSPPQYALKNRPILGATSPLPAAHDVKDLHIQRNSHSPPAASSSLKSPARSSTPKATSKLNQFYLPHSDDKNPFESANLVSSTSRSKSTSPKPANKKASTSSPSASFNAATAKRPRISFQNRQIVPLQPHELQDGPIITQSRSAQASPKKSNKIMENSPQKDYEQFTLSTMDPIRRDLFKALTGSPEKRSASAKPTSAKVPSETVIIPSKKTFQLSDDDDDDDFIHFPIVSSAPIPSTKPNPSPEKQALPTIVFGKGDSKKVFVHSKAGAIHNSDPESLTDDSDVAVIAEIKLGPSASELLKSKSPSPSKKPTSQKSSVSSVKHAANTLHSPKKRSAPLSSPSKSLILSADSPKKKQKMVSFKDSFPIVANGIEYSNTATLEPSVHSLASWEDLIICVDVIAPADAPNLDQMGIIVCTKWRDGSRVYTSLEVGKAKFPVKMVEYYEKYVRFAD